MRWRLALLVIVTGATLTGCPHEHDLTSDAGGRTTPPPVGAAFDYQLGGAYEPPAGTTLVARQWLDGQPLTNGYSICYVNAFQTEAEADSPDHASAWPDGTVLLDEEDPAWPGEHPIDLATAASRAHAADFVEQRLDRCAKTGFDAVEFDNLDTYTRYPQAIERADAIAYATDLAQRADRLGLAVGQKNTAELLDVRNDIGFTFAVVEECGATGECQQFSDAYDGRVFDIEYDDASFEQACTAIGSTASVIRRDLPLSEPGVAGYRFDRC